VRNPGLLLIVHKISGRTTTINIYSSTGSSNYNISGVYEWKTPHGWRIENLGPNNVRIRQCGSFGGAKPGTFGLHPSSGSC